MRKLRPWLAAVGMWLFLPAAVLFSWPVLLWWIARVLASTAHPWLATFLAIAFGLQIGVLTNRPLGADVFLLGGTVAFLELWSPSSKDWRRRGGDIILGGLFCAIFLLAGNNFDFSVWLMQLGVLIVVNLAEAMVKLGWLRP